QAEDGIRDFHVTGVQTCALPICRQTCPSCFAFRTGLAPLVTGNGLAHFSGGRARIWTSSAAIRLSSNQTIRFEKISAVGSGKIRSEERRVGKACRSRGAQDQSRQ